MITHIRVVTIAVRDQDKALDFYVNKLGFEKRADEPMGGGARWVEVAPPNAETVFVLAQGYGGGEANIGKFVGVVLATDNLEETYKTYAERGVHFTVPPKNEPWGKWAQFVDQDGTEFGLREEPKA